MPHKEGKNKALNPPLATYPTWWWSFVSMVVFEILRAINCQSTQSKKKKNLYFSVIHVSEQGCVPEMPPRHELFCWGPVGVGTWGSFWRPSSRRVCPNSEVSLCREPASCFGWGVSWVRLNPPNSVLAFLGDAEVVLRWVSSKHFAFSKENSCG